MNLAQEKIFTESLEHLRRDCDEATQYLYGYLATYKAIGDDPYIYNALNHSPRYWMTILSGMQTAKFIVLGRMFDTNGHHQLINVIKKAAKDPSIFDRESLRQRKSKNSLTQIAWIEEYLDTAYRPTQRDFDRMLRYANKYKSVYERRCKDIRSKVFSHNIVTDANDVEKLFNEVSYRHLARILAFVDNLHDCLWQLLNNGKLRPLRLGKPNRLPDSALLDGKGGTNYIGFQMAKSAERFLNQLTNRQH